jgi:hypothetical protein
LLGRLGCLLGRDEFSVPGPLDGAARLRIVRAVRDCLAPESMRELRRRLQAASGPPATDWDLRLEEWARRQAGEGRGRGVVESALDRIERIAADRRTERALRAVRNALAPGE